MPEAPIAITGMHRSGTSMITRALHDSGLHLIGTGAEELIDAAEDNPEGFWENKAIVACNDELLEATGGAWDNPPELPPQAIDDPRVAHVAEASMLAIAALSEHDHWGFKDPRTCLTAAYWLDLEPELRFIVCVRHPLEVALSLKRRNQNSYSLGLALWERYYATVLEQVPADRRIVTHYDTFFLDPEGELARLCEFAGLEPAATRVRRDLRHHDVGVDLGDAGASASLRALYADLCRAALVAPPRDAPVDEGRVRRLILDGTVAQRHADQRQAAIERLQEREQELRDERAEVEARHRSAVRDLENKLAAVRRDAAVQASTLTRIDRRISHLPSVLLERAARRYVLRPGRRLLGRSRQTVVPTARTAVHELPAPARQAIRRTRGLVRRGVDDPGRTAKTTARRVLRSARQRARELPPPAQQALRRGESLFRGTTTAPGPTAKRVVRRLPAPAQRLSRRGWVVVLRARRARRDRSLVAEHASKSPPTPKGPAYRLWKPAYERMVAGAWTGEGSWLVVRPGSPAAVRDARSPRATFFPDQRHSPPSGAGQSHVAQLEAHRYDGHQRLVLPEGSRPWFRQQTELREHVVRSYRTETDLAGAGAVFDLTLGSDAGRQTLRSAVEDLAVDLTPPAVLDWTGLDLIAELRDLPGFKPPGGEGLPYLDSSVDVVVIDESRHKAEASRVASLGVITVSAGASGAVVKAIDPVGSRAEVPRPRVLVWSASGIDPRWAPAIADRATAAGADLHLGPLSAAGLDGSSDHQVVVIVEPLLLPLPGTIEAAAALLESAPHHALAGKVLRGDGRLESVGGSVFFDRSVALIAEGSPDVRAAWHEFARPVCWAPGLLAVGASLLAAVPPPPHVTERAFLREWCAAAWAHGAQVVYQPSLAAVRVGGHGGEPATPVSSSSWQRVLDLRPRRPASLGDGAWRYLLAHDDVEACRG